MKILKIWKRMMVTAVVMCMVLCGLFISVPVKGAEPGETTVFVDYQFTCTVDTVNKSCTECTTVTVTEDVSGDSNPKVISGTNGIYQLEVGKKYKCTVSGDKIQMPYVETESFTAETQKVVGMPNSHDVRIPMDYLKYDFQDTICCVGETISFDDWKEFGWMWSLDHAEDASKLQIEDNAGKCKMTGKEIGKVSVSRRIYDSSNNEVYIQTKEITVEPKKIRFNIHYGSDAARKINAAVELKDSNNAVIDSQNGGYQLNAGQEYKYTVSGHGIITKTGTITPKEDDYVINIPVELVEPTFTLNGTDWKDITGIKSGSNVIITCNNIDELYDSNNWISDISGVEAGLTGIPVEKKAEGYGTFSFSCQYSNFGKMTYTKPLSENYSLKGVYYTDYDKKEYIEPIDCEFDLTADKLEYNEETTVTVKAPGYRDSTVTVIPGAESEIKVEVGEMIMPTFICGDTLNVYCGDKIDLSTLVTPDFSLEQSWEWYINERKTDNIISGEPTFTFNQAGTYTLIYGCTCYPYQECKIAVNVNKIPLSVDLDKFNAWFEGNHVNQSKNYDTTKRFEIKIDFNADAFGIDMQGADKNTLNAPKPQNVILQADVESANAGTYNCFDIKEVSLDGDGGQYFDISNVNTSLKNQRIAQNVNLKINKQELKVNSFVPVLEYRTLKLNENETKNKIKFQANLSAEIQDDYADKLLRLMGDLLVTDVNLRKCEYKNGDFKTEAGTGYIYLEDSNIKYKFESAAPAFQYEYIREDITKVSAEIKDNILYTMGTDKKSAFLMNEVEAFPGTRWCNKGNKIFAEIQKGDFFGKQAYQDITLLKINNVPDWESMKNFDISDEEGQKGGDSININPSEEEYYKLILHPENDQYQYCSVIAAVVRIVPEEKIAEYESFPDTINNYPVITMLQDNTAPVVDYKGRNKDELNRSEELLVSNAVQTDNAVRNKSIAFTVTDGCSGVIEIGYAFGTVDRSKIWYNRENHTYPVDKIEVGDYTALQVTPAGDYSVPIPQSMESGDYVLYVKVKDNTLKEQTYISNAFIIDKIPPQTEFTFVKENGENVTGDVLAGKDVYSVQNVELTINLKEEHFDRSEIKVSRTNAKGKQIGETNYYEFTEADELDKLVAHVPLVESGNYHIEVLAYDKAGNVSHEVDGKPEPEVYFITVDKDSPNVGSINIEGTVHIISDSQDAKKGLVNTVAGILEKTWNSFMTMVVYNAFGEDEIKYIMSGADEISPVDISYYMTDRELAEDDLKKLSEDDWIAWNSDSGNAIAVNTGYIIYERVRDKAGNISYFSTEGIISDNHKPDIVLSLEAPNKNGFYNGDVGFDVSVEDKVPENGLKASGLQYVSYRIEKAGINEKSEVLLDISEKKKAGTNAYSFSKNVAANEFNGNDVLLCITAVDNAGNIKEEKKPIMIDNVKPVISVSYNDSAGVDYYNHVRKATVTIKERNLNVDDVKIVAKGNSGVTADIGEWTHSNDIGESDEAVYWCNVTFSKEDDYEFIVDCVDKAGNRAEREFSDKFTLDMTKPVIDVSYNGVAPEQDAYYNQPVTATITITEHNFNAEKVDIETHAENGYEPSMSGFSSNGDVHTATVSYNADGTYRLDVTCTDEADNAAEDYNGNNFTVDLTAPEINISNIEDKSANKGDVKPVITCTDENYSQDKVEIKLYGANNGELDLKNVSMTVQEVNGGQQFTFDFPKNQMMDDLYTLSAKVEDKAGNETEKSIEFSVNRFGSVYTLGKATEEWIENGVYAYIKESNPVVIIETNVDEVMDRNIGYTVGGVNATVVTLNEAGECNPEEKDNGTYYEVKDNSSGNKWYQYEYTIRADNFKSEGRYSVQIDSTDKAGNHASNVSNKHADGSLIVEFAVDQTAPSAVITGAENGEIYNEDKHTVYLDIQDNMAMDYVTIFLNGNEYGTYKAEDIEELGDGLIPIEVKQAMTTQTIQLMAKDAAGNILSKSAQNKYDKSFDDFQILVTTNVFVRILHTIWIWIVVIAFIVGGVVAVLVLRTKKRQ